MSTLKTLKSDKKWKYTTGTSKEEEEIKSGDRINLEINTTIENASVLYPNKTGLTVRLPDGIIFHIPQMLHSNTLISKSLDTLDINRQQQVKLLPLLVFKTKNGDPIIIGDYIKLTFMKEKIIPSRIFIRGAKNFYNEEFPIIPVNYTYKTGTVLFGKVANISFDNKELTFEY
jgi:hypothetical protein